MNYIPIIGLEIHVELKTSSKMFCSCSAQYFGEKPNTHVCPVCLGLPGALPIPNKQAIEWCAILGLALNCQIPKFSKFDRKNYFYPDLPKGYQISQYDLPLSVNGWVKVGERKIGIRRVHQEEDTAKLIHATVGGEKMTLIDFNRSGVPLVEIVTEPEIRSANEAKVFLQKLQQIIRYLGISDCDMEKGSMRLEPNISLSQDGKLPNYKVEVKNINSFRFVERAIEYEIKRQQELLNEGKIPAQETRGFDEGKMRTLPQRGKEEAQDYRYFPEPDIPPIRWDPKTIDRLKSKLPELPDAKLARFISQYSLSEYDAVILAATREKGDYFEEAVRVGQEHGVRPKQLANVLINRKVDIDQVLPANLVKIIGEKSKGPQMAESDLEKIVEQVLLDNPSAVSDYKKGKNQALMFLVGQVMRAAKGKAGAQEVKEKIISLLKEK